MHRLIKNKVSLATILSGMLFLMACSKPADIASGKQDVAAPSETKPAVMVTPIPTAAADVQPTTVLSPEQILDIKPNESGRIMVVMFHNFVEAFQAKQGDSGEYTTSFQAFENLLETLYQKDYRLIGMEDFLNNTIRVPAGKIPILFTFDDGTPGQFHLIEENGQFIANPKSAVGILEAFHRKHPDFGEKGVFYLNLGNPTFEGKGSLQQRLQFLVNKGYEIGNHTYSHVNLKQIKDADILQKEIGGNHNKMMDLIPGYQFKTFSLPYGIPSADLRSYVERGKFEGISYENKSIMEVGWDPSYAPGHKNLNLLSVHRVRASGIKPVQADLAWWLMQLSRNEQYVSDGNPDTITFPKAKESQMLLGQLQGKKVVIY